MRKPRRAVLWRMVSLVTFVLAGGLFVISGLSSHGLDLRAASVSDLDTVVRQERARADDLADRVAALTRTVNRLTKQVDDTNVRRLQHQVDLLRGPAGFEAVRGPGLTVTLDDAPKSEIDRVVESGELAAKSLYVHQQDIQAVVNALWSGGAEAMTLQGQRVVSTTGIKCVGNTVVLQGVPYSPPYVISAIGDPGSLAAGLDSNEYVAAYKTFVSAYDLGYDVESSADLKMPGYSGSVDLRYARPAPPANQPRSAQ